MSALVGLSLMGACSGGDDAAVTSTSAAPASTIAATPASTLPWSDTVPQFAYPPPVDPLAMSIVDEQGRNCVQVLRPNGDTGSLCQEKPEEMSVNVSPADPDGTVYVYGLTASDTADHVVASLGGTAFRVELKAIDGWLERAFAASLPAVPTIVELIDANGTVLASQLF